MTFARTRIVPVLLLALATLVGPSIEARGWRQELKATAEIQSKLDTARQALDRQQLAAALRLFREALEAAKAAGDRKGEADALRGVGFCRTLAGDVNGGIADLKQSISVCESLGDKLGAALANNLVGTTYMAVQNLREATTYVQRAYDLLESIQNRTQIGGVLVNLASIRTTEGNPRQAIPLLERAIPILQETKNRPFEANALLALGEAHRGLGNVKEARSAYMKAKALYAELGNVPGQAGVLFNLGLLYWDAGEAAQSQSFYSQALALVGNNAPPDLRGRLLLGTGEIALAGGDYKTALERLTQAAQLFKIAGEPFTERAARELVGVTHIRLGRPDIALEIFEGLRRDYEQLGSPEAVANMDMSIAGALLDQGNLPLALEKLQRCADQASALGVSGLAATANANMGFVHRDAGRIDKALAVFRRGLAQAIRDRDTQGEGHSRAAIAECLADNGNGAAARAEAERALAIQRKFPDAAALAHTYSILGRAARLQGDHSASVKWYGEAVKVVERSRSQLGGFTDSKASFGHIMRPIYLGALQANLHFRQSGSAFQIAQKMKARGLLDLMAAGRVDVWSSLSPKEHDQLKTLQLNADFLNQEMVKEGVRNEVGSKARYEALRRQLAQAEERLQRTLEALYVKYPGIATKASARVARASDVAKKLPRDAAVLEYVHVSPRELVVFVLRNVQGKAKVTAKQFPLGSFDLAGKAAAFRAACADPRKPVEPLASEMYRVLLRPIAGEIASAKRLVVCPDGPLWDVPFQALKVSKTGPFVAERHEVVVAHSATALLAALNAPPSLARQSMLVVANPNFGPGTRFGDLDEIPGQRPIEPPSRPIEPPSRTFAGMVRAGRIVPLPGTQREADLLEKGFGATVLTGDRAQESVTKRIAGNYRNLHFATHGMFNDASPWLSSILLAQPEPGSTDDGFLTAREIFELDLRSDMVVLSACNTARGVARNGDGVIGLTWALFAAGCPTQVVSQWAVDDASTASLMEAFYGSLRDIRMDKGRALSIASRKLLRDPKTKHPYYWAPFVLMGSWR